NFQWPKRRRPTMETKITRAKEKKGTNMKTLFLALALILTAGCGGAIPQAVVDPQENNQEQNPVPEEEPFQPFILQEVGNYIPDGNIALKPLPSGNWLIFGRSGTVHILNPN